MLMKWMFHIPDDGLASAGRQLTITADNWFAALNDGLARCNGTAVGNISCIPTDEGSVEVRDFVSGRVFYLHPFSPGETPGGLSTHIEIFGGSDEVASDGAVSYRERLVYVPSGMSVAASEAIARDVLEANMKPAADDQLVVAVHVYDHRFTDRPVRPALVRLAWQQWNPNNIIVDYPLSGDDDPETGLATSYLLTHTQEATAAVLDSGDTSADGVAITEKSETQGDTDDDDLNSKHRRKTQGRKVTHLSLSENTAMAQVDEPNQSEGERKTLPAVAAVDGGVMFAFEQLQEMYTIKGHDDVAAFIRDTLIQAIPSEACAVLLNTPGKDELYVAAEEGFTDIQPEKVRISFVGGIVEAALRNGAVLNVSDPDDERFNVEVDLRGSFAVRNVLVSPVAFEGHTFGVIELYNREIDAEFDQEDANALSYVAGAFAEYVCNYLPSREPEFSDKEFAQLKAEAAQEAARRRKLNAEARAVALAAAKRDARKKQLSTAAPKKSSGDAKVDVKRKTESARADAARGKKVDTSVEDRKVKNAHASTKSGKSSAARKKQPKK